MKVCWLYKVLSLSTEFLIFEKAYNGQGGVDKNEKTPMAIEP